MSIQAMSSEYISVDMELFNINFVLGITALLVLVPIFLSMGKSDTVNADEQELFKKLKTEYDMDLIDKEKQELEMWKQKELTRKAEELDNEV